MRAEREVEVKLGVPDGFVPPQLGSVPGVDHVAVRGLRLRATYWDTADHRLAQAGMTLRHRTGEGRPRWTLKTASAVSDGLDREEISVHASGTAVPAQLLDLLTARTRGAAVQPLAQVHTSRTTTLLFDADGAELVEVVDDVVTVLRDGTQVDGWHEFEVEQREGGRKAFRKVVAALEQAGTTAVDQTPKGIRALGVLGPPDLPPVPRVATAGDLVRSSLAVGLAAVVARDLEVRRDVPDGIHQLRVACRRLRSDLRTFAVLIDDGRVPTLRRELSWLAGELGAARDLEVLRERLHLRALEGDPLEVVPVDALLAAEQSEAEAAAGEALRSPRYLALLRLLHAVAWDPGLSDRAAQRAEDVLPPLVEAAERRLAKAVAALEPDGPDDAWHDARIRAKRARYAAEAVGLRAKPAKKLQTLLGEHQDAAVAAERLASLGEQHPSLAVLCGRLVERERLVVRRVREKVRG